MTRSRTLIFPAFLIALIVIGIFLLSSDSAMAQTAAARISTGLDSAAGTAYDQDLTLPTFIGNIIRVLLAASGMIFIVITIYAGVLYITAFGEAEKTKKARSMLTTSVIGLAIIVGAYALTNYVVDALTEASTPPTSTSASASTTT